MGYIAMLYMSQTCTKQLKLSHAPVYCCFIPVVAEKQSVKGCCTSLFTDFRLWPEQISDAEKSSLSVGTAL